MTNWRDLGDTTVATYEAEFRRLGSPMLPHAAAIHAAAVPHSRLALAIMFHEKKYDTRTEIIPASFRNPLAVGKPEGGKGQDRWERYGSYPEAVTAWRQRVTSPAYKGGVYARTATLAELVAVYAPAHDHNDEGRYVAVLEERLAAFPRTEETPPMPPTTTRPRILLTRGHGTTGDTGAFAGGQSEEVHNKRIIVALAAALRAGGYDVTTFPANPADDVPGTLDTEGAFARQWIAKTPGDVVMLDCHLESSSARGIFAIVANDIGLTTYAAGAQPATDTYAGNAGDRALGKAICEEISRLTGVPIRTGWVKEPGLMSEDMTYVGGQGWRLAMFGYTAEYHQRAYRLVVEFANLQHDAAFYTRADFPERCGQGVVAAMNRVFGVATEPGTPDAPASPRYATPKPIAALARLDAGDRDGLDAVSLKEGGSFRVFRREVEAIRDTPRYQVANTASKGRVGPDIEQGGRFVPAWAFTTEEGAEWYLSAAWTRVLVADTKVVDETPVQAA